MVQLLIAQSVCAFSLFVALRVPSRGPDWPPAPDPAPPNTCCLICKMNQGPTDLLDFRVALHSCQRAYLTSLPSSRKGQAPDSCRECPPPWMFKDPAPVDSWAGREEARALESKEEASGQLCHCQLCVLNLLSFVLLINGASPTHQGRWTPRGHASCSKFKALEWDPPGRHRRLSLFSSWAGILLLCGSDTWSVRKETITVPHLRGVVRIK